MKTSTELQRYSLSGETMGTRYTALFYAETELDTRPISRSLAHAEGRVDQQMSTWKADSDPDRLQQRTVAGMDSAARGTDHGIVCGAARQPPIGRRLRYRRW